MMTTDQPDEPFEETPADDADTDTGQGEEDQSPVLPSHPEDPDADKLGNFA